MEIKKAVKSVLIGWGTLTFIFAVVYLGVTFPVVGILMMLLVVFLLVSAVMIAIGSNI